MACRTPGHPSGIQRHPPGQNLVTQLLHALDLVTASFASLFRSLVGRDQPVLVKRHAFQAAGADARRGPVLLEQIPFGHRRAITAHALTGLWPHLPRLTGTCELSGLIRDGLFRQTLLEGFGEITRRGSVELPLGKAVEARGDVHMIALPHRVRHQQFGAQLDTQLNGL
jgi:hypothetical protein